ncbi:hypothetical protein EJK55_0238 [Moraxella catarrhalis]|uniref:Uncharacterized protein n=1 Tax=Moraxella catarrhalis TaxID=480 RepID=A0A3S9QGX5_MORCA|nr:hypothetical protein MCR_0533 [Moraxella catarrhalis BBH18]AZQ86698.1 hypothetical protein EJK52_0565 [Moraxella catarrhalis]EKF84071.1 hypothetical protein MCRH_0587 [Moraxella catarrhalis RH4]AZQ89485.1 hypothetical protein EJK50_0564 [Moraxella catarrhalis]AZQ90588.1 hypothetical protein EJK51_0563 [Moraxella catarrhalis]
MVIEINPNDEFAYITHFIQKNKPKVNICQNFLIFNCFDLKLA